MRELGIPPWVIVPEPNTWRELLAAVDEKRIAERLSASPCRNTAYRIPIFSKGLEARGARVTTVPVYRWALPEDLAPLRAAIDSRRAR